MPRGARPPRLQSVSPDRRVTTFIKDQYLTPTHVDDIVSTQRAGPAWLRSCLVSVLAVLSVIGQGTLCVAYIVPLLVLGYVEDFVYFSMLLGLALYLVDAFKDFCSCPRPPSPPVARHATKSHYDEYGFPSAHSALAGTLAYCAAVFFVQQGVAEPTTAAVAAACFVAAMSFSRYYLGAHWLADIVGGLFIFVALAAVDTAGFREWFLHTVTRPEGLEWWHLLLPFAIGRVFVVVHPMPVDPCPCFLDSTRFVGVNTGWIVGHWISILTTGHGTVALSQHAFSLRSVVMYVAVPVVLLLCGDVATFFTSRAMPPLLHFLAGGAHKGIPQGPCRSAYLAACSAFGVLFGKRIRRASAPQPPLDDGVVWSLRTHGHWTEALVAMKFLSYFTTGVLGASPAAAWVVDALVGL